MANMVLVPSRFFVQCLFTSNMLVVLASNGEQLAVLKEQLKRLEAALWKADALVTKWSKPMGLNVVVCFVKSDLDKDAIKDVSTADGSSTG